MWVMMSMLNRDISVLVLGRGQIKKPLLKALLHESHILMKKHLLCQALLDQHLDLCERGRILLPQEKDVT